MIFWLLCLVYIRQGLLKSTDTLVLAATCAAIATIAKDNNNLAVLSDHRVIPMLADLGNIFSFIMMNFYLNFSSIVT